MTTGASRRTVEHGEADVQDRRSAGELPSRRSTSASDPTRRRPPHAELVAQTLGEYVRAWLRAHPRRRRRRPAGHRRPHPHLDPVPVAQLELPHRRQPRQPAHPGLGLHAAGDGRGLRAAARRDRPLHRVRRRHRRRRHGRAAQARHRVARGRRPSSSRSLVTAAIGVLHGTLITRLGLPSFVVTLAGLLGWQGVMLLDPRAGRRGADQHQRHQRPHERPPHRGRQLDRDARHRRALRRPDVAARLPPASERSGRAARRPHRAEDRRRARRRRRRRARSATPTAAS